MSFQSKSELSFTDAHSVGQRYRPNTSQPSRKRKLPFDKILDRGVVLEAKRGKSDASDNFSMNDSAIDDELKDLGWRVLSGKSMFQIHGEIVVEDKLTQGMSKEIRSESNIPGTYVTKTNGKLETVNWFAYAPCGSSKELPSHTPAVEPFRSKMFSRFARWTDGRLCEVCNKLK